MQTNTLTPAETAAYLKRSYVTLERWRRLRVGPPFYRINGRPMYDVADVDAWIAAQKKATAVGGVH